MLERFANITILIQALREQHLIAHDLELATEIARRGQLVEFKRGEFLMRQHDPDCDLFFILDGEVSILINGHEKGLFRQREHVGEMAGLDRSRRSACVKVATDTIALKLAWDQFELLADANPKVWRYIATKLTHRLRERGKFMRPPNPESRIFIGSSRESLSIAVEIESMLNSRGAKKSAKAWTNPEIFIPSETTIESLLKEADQADFAVLVCGPDDIVTSRNKKSQTPRDNVIFELGLFMGSLGRSRTFFARPSGMKLKLPSDLHGLTPLSYQMIGSAPDLTTISHMVDELIAVVEKRGPHARFIQSA